MPGRVRRAAGRRVRRPRKCLENGQPPLRQRAAHVHGLRPAHQHQRLAGCELLRNRTQRANWKGCTIHDALKSCRRRWPVARRPAPATRRLRAPATTSSAAVRWQSTLLIQPSPTALDSTDITGLPRAKCKFERSRLPRQSFEPQIRGRAGGAQCSPGEAPLAGCWSAWSACRWGPATGRPAAAPAPRPL